MLEVSVRIVLHANLLHYPPRAYIPRYGKRDQTWQPQISECMIDNRTGPLRGQPASPNFEGESQPISTAGMNGA